MFRSALVAAGLTLCLVAAVWIQNSSSGCWSASSEAPKLSDVAPSDIVDQYVRHFRAMVGDFNEISELIETIDDAESAEQVFGAVDARCDEMSSLVDEAKALPELNQSQAARLLEVFESEIQEDFHTATNRLLASAVRANEQAHGTPAIKRLSKRFRRLATNIDAALSMIER